MTFKTIHLMMRFVGLWFAFLRKQRAFLQSKKNELLWIVTLLLTAKCGRFQTPVENTLRRSLGGRLYTLEIVGFRSSSATKE